MEGIRPVGEAVEAGAGIEFILFAPDLLTSEFALRLIAEQSARGAACLAVSPEVFASLAEKENPQGILAVVRQRLVPLAELSPDSLGWGVAVVSPQDPGNVGAFLRTMDAVGADGLILLDDAVDPYHPTAVRASMGAISTVPLATATFGQFAEWARRNLYHVFGASAHGSVEHAAVPAYPRPRILLLGSEREGLSKEQAAVCEKLIRLPMRGRVSSLNLAVAAGIMLYAMLESDAS